MNSLTSIIYDDEDLTKSYKMYDGFYYDENDNDYYNDDYHDDDGD